VEWVSSYSASSPDELALVNAAKILGVRFASRPAKNQIVLEYSASKIGGLLNKDKVDTFEVLHVFEFTSNRKRMSVVVRTPSGRVKVLTKGSDCVLKKLLARIDGSTIQERE
jgi:magnesium-transporting ATPase (P-type)